jgi:hypothetical protein
MNNEFRKTSNKDQTVYTLESATSGGTSSGSIASVSTPLGGMQRRNPPGDNILAQEADKKKIPSSTPRNFVAKNAKTGGAGKMKDKSKTIPRHEKHKKAVAEGVSDLSYDAQSLITKLRRDVEEKRLQPTPQAVLAAARELAGDMEFAPQLLVKQVLGQGVAEGSRDDDDEYGPKAREEWLKQQAYEKEYNKKKPSTPVKPVNKNKQQSVAEAEYNPDTFVGKKGTYKGYGITQEGPSQWGISSSVRKFSTLAAAKRHIDKVLVVSEQGVAEGSKIPMVKDSETGKKHPDYGNTRMMRDLAAAAQKRKSQPPTEPNSNDLSTYNDFPDTNKHPWMPVMIGEPSWANIPKSLEIWARRKGIHRDIDISHDPEGKIWTIRGKSGYPHDTEYTFHWEYDYDHNQFEPVEQGVAEGFNGEYDDEAGMAQSNLLTSARAVMGLLKTIGDKDNLPEWCQEKIAKAEMMLVSVWDYLQSQKAMGNDPQQGVAEGDAYMESLQDMLERSVSQAQHNLMVGVAHNPQFAQKVKVKQQVGQEFAKADTGRDISKLPMRVSKKK